MLATEADFGFTLMTMNAPDYDLLRALKYRERWRYIPFAGQIQEALDRDDPSAIVPFFLLLMRGRWMKLKTYLRCQNGTRKFNGVW